MKNLEKVKELAKDLRREEPRSPDEQLGGFEGAARCIDKCRATLVGWQGEYVYGCPMDQNFLTAAAIGANELKAFVATGAVDSEIANWIEEHAVART
jgi:hypothetical protein